MTLLLSLLFAACGPAALESEVRTPTLPSSDSGFVGAARSVEGVHIAPDITGDGVQDLLVHTSQARTLVIPGPLSGIGGIDLDDAVAEVLHHRSWLPVSLYAADVDGDGITDIACKDRVVYGPVGLQGGEPEIVDGNQATPYPGTPIDLDGDGVMERFDIRSDGVVELFAASGDDPIAVLETGCERATALQIFPDLDGDGARELLWSGFPSVACPSRWIPANVRGTVDVTSFPAATRDVAAALGDITGDGHPDLVTTRHSVRAGPFDLTLSSLGGTELADLSERGHQSFRALPFDLNGDGLHELEYILLQDPASPRSIVSWAQGLDRPLLSLPRVGVGNGTDTAYTVEDGRALLVEVTGQDNRHARIIDLGPVVP